MQGIFAGRTQLRYPYGRYGYTRGGGKIWHGGMDLVGLDSTDIRMPYYKNKRITGKVVRARRVTDHSNKTWEWGWYVCVQLDPGQTPDDVNYLYFCHCRDAVGVYGKAPGQADPGEENEENADAAKKLQRISIGPVSRGDADAVYAVCVSRGLVAAGLYKSGWSV